MFGSNLKQLREKNGYSMDKLVELYNTKYSAKMNKSTLSRYENGLQDPIYTVVVNLADFFNVSVDYLIGREDMSEEDDLNTQFKDLLHNRRLELDLTLEEVGNKVGVSKATVLRWESGEIKNLRRDKIAKLADALQTTPAYLMGWTEKEETEKEQPAKGPPLTEKQKYAFELVLKVIDEKNLDRLIDFLQLLIKAENQ